MNALSFLHAWEGGARTVGRSPPVFDTSMHGEGGGGSSFTLLEEEEEGGKTSFSRLSANTSQGKGGTSYRKAAAPPPPSGQGQHSPYHLERGESPGQTSAPSSSSHIFLSPSHPLNFRRFLTAAAGKFLSKMPPSSSSSFFIPWSDRLRRLHRPSACPPPLAGT